MMLSPWRRGFFPAFLVLALASMVLAAACGGDDNSADADEEPVATAGDIEVYAPAVRFTLGDTAAGYFTVRNTGDEEERLVGAESSATGMVELHETVTENGASSMQPIGDGIDIPAGEEVTLTEGGMHVMMMGIEEPLEDGEEVTLTLTFEEAGEVSFTVPASQRTGGGDDDHTHEDGEADHSHEDE